MRPEQEPPVIGSVDILPDFGGQKLFPAIIQRAHGRQKRTSELPVGRSAVRFLNDALCDQVAASTSRASF